MRSTTPLPPDRVPGAFQAFRGETRASAKLHPYEKALLVVVCTHLCFMPWALGTMHVWSQTISLGFSVIEIILALVNRQYDEETSDEGRFKLIMWPKLVRFPIFWLGLALLLYITIQALNPSWAYRTNGKEWWMQPIDHIKWLPTGMDTPFKDMNAWRMLMIYGSTWLLSSALWVGITRRKTIIRILGSLTINATIFAFIGILQRLTGNGKILWLIEAPKEAVFFSSIIYKNHAAAYMNLCLAIGASLIFYYRSSKSYSRNSPYPIFVLLATTIAIGSAVSVSRAGLALLVAYLVSACIIAIIYRSSDKFFSNWKLTCTCAILMFALAIVAFQNLQIGERLSEVVELAKNQSEAYTARSRMLARDATLQMATDKISTGWGAGSFRHYFPVYQQRFPEIDKPWGFQLRWQYAHNDYLQILAELGIMGTSLLSGIGIWITMALAKAKFHRNAFVVALVIAIPVTLCHCWVDFQLYNPSVLMLFGIIPILATRWSELTKRNHLK